MRFIQVIFIGIEIKFINKLCATYPQQNKLCQFCRNIAIV